MVRFEELCFYCPCYTYCEGTLGDTCEYGNLTWHQVRKELQEGLKELEPEEVD